jgi:hypothetical protein
MNAHARDVKRIRGTMGPLLGPVKFFLEAVFKGENDVSKAFL